MSLGVDFAAERERAVELAGVAPKLEALRRRHVEVPAARRAAVVSAIRAKTEAAPSDPARDAALERLAAGAAVIVSGQQPGLLGGPLLTIWKAATTVRLVRELQREGRDVVAVFWNASEDHDLDEADRFFQLGADGSVRLRHARPAGAGRSLDRIVFDAAAVTRITSWFDREPPSALPRAGDTFGTAATRFMHEAFAGTGLVVVEPRWFADELRDLVDRAVTRNAHVRAAFEEGCRRVVEAGYEAQLAPPDEEWTGLFISDDTGRRGLRLSAAGGTVGGEHVTLEALRGLRETAPDSFSSSAALRPLAQRELLPVLAQVAGPSEIAYLVQLRALFESEFGFEFPVPWPRAGGLLVRAQERAAADLLGLDDDDLLAGPASWPTVSSDLPDGWAAALESIENDLRDALVTTDVELDRLLAPSRREARKVGKELRKRLTRHVKERNRPRARARHGLEQCLWPRGRAQDRTLAAASLGFDAKSVARAMIDAVDVTSRDRVVIDIREE